MKWASQTWIGGQQGANLPYVHPGGTPGTNQETHKASTAETAETAETADNCATRQNRPLKLWNLIEGYGLRWRKVNTSKIPYSNRQMQTRRVKTRRVY